MSTRICCRKKNKFLLPSQSGFRKGKSTMDVLMQIEHHIRKSLQNKEICLIVYIDLESAFDKIWGGGLIYKLCKKGMHGRLIRWLENYFEGRTMQVRLDGYTSAECIIESGVPQGGVCSPILFNLMLMDIPQMDGIQQHIYADDLTVTCSGNDKENIKVKLQQYLNMLVKWCRKWGLKINPKKTYIQMYTRKRVEPPVIRVMHRVLEYKTEHRLLGLILDAPTLTWKKHIEALKISCMQRLNIMKAVASTNWGASKTVLRQIYILYIQSKIDYGSVVYSSAAESTLQKLDIIQNNAMRLILGARKSSPILSIQAESCIPPLTLKRGYLIIKDYVKLAYSPENDYTANFLGIGKDNEKLPANSLVVRAKEFCNVLNIEQIKCIPTERVSDVPPWIKVSSLIKHNKEGEDVDRNELFCDYISQHYEGYKQLYTDGSKIGQLEKSTACGMYNPQQKLGICWKIRTEHSVVSAEIFAIYKALLYIESVMPQENVLIFTNSMAALNLISSVPEKYITIVNKIQKLLILLNKTREVYLHWVKSHTGISGNEIADKVAKLGHKNNRTEVFELNKDEWLSILKSKFKSYWNGYWHKMVQSTNKGKALLEIRSKIQDKIPLAFKKRRMEVVLSRLRIGHVGLASYLYRFNILNTEMCNMCNVPETVLHFIMHCRKYANIRNEMYEKLTKVGVKEITLKCILGGDNTQNYRTNKIILRITSEYITATNRMSEL